MRPARYRRPIFHVNGDDPEACVRVVKLALEYRNAFNKDVVIDMLCYRVRGHNEGDEPTYTQPLLYRKIEEKRSPAKIVYGIVSCAGGEMDPEEAEEILRDYRDRLQDAFDQTTSMDAANGPRILRPRWRRPPRCRSRSRTPQRRRKTCTLWPTPWRISRRLCGCTRSWCASFSATRTLVPRASSKVGWAYAEALAFGSLLLEGTTVRLSGQDSRVGPRSASAMRCSIDQQTGREYIPLNNIRESQANLHIYDSLLSEYAVLGFEYGYSVADPSALVIWEAQFGDFANGAQIVFDQFLALRRRRNGRSRAAWLRCFRMDGKGRAPNTRPRASSAFLQMCAEENMIVCNHYDPGELFPCAAGGRRAGPTANR